MTIGMAQYENVSSIAIIQWRYQFKSNMSIDGGITSIATINNARYARVTP
jgi:hypothetical protein